MTVQTGGHRVVAAGVCALLSSAAYAQQFSETFTDITSLPGAGWDLINLSQPMGATGWFQGNTDVVPSHEQPGYIAANFGNVAGQGAISTWLILPPLHVTSGDRFLFWTRTVMGSPHPDRLQVRLSTNGASNNVGSDAQSVGDFSSLLLDINPEMNTRDFPDEWTRYTVTISGVPPQTLARLAFRYYIPAGTGVRGNYIGIDNLEYFVGPPPAPFCYANCDGSTASPILNANDFQCFLSSYAAGDTYANCDGSTASPLLTANDFQCYLNLFMQGCS